MGFQSRMGRWLPVLVLTISAAMAAPAGAELCGMAGSDGAIAGTGYAGYWRTTWGTMRLVRFRENILEGPSSASDYFRGTEAGDIFAGRFAHDPGRFYTGNFTMTLSENGRCLKGTLTYDGGDQDEIIGYRIQRPSMPYREIYELTPRTEHLKSLVGGILDFGTLDGPDVRAFFPGPTGTSTSTGSGNPLGLPMVSPANPPADDSEPDTIDE